MKATLLKQTGRLLLAGTFLTTSLAAVAGEMRLPLTPEQRTNGVQTLAAVEMMRTATGAVTARIVDGGGRTLTTATWIGADGYFLTKASDATRLDKCRIEWGEGRSAAIREIRREAAYDLALAQAVGVADVSFAAMEAGAQPDYGEWLATPIQAGKELRIGVVSAKRRLIRGEGAAIGISMDKKGGDGKGGVRIAGIAEDSPAAEAGLLANDIMLELEKEVLTDSAKVTELIKSRQPGEEIEVKYRRGTKETSVRIRLASRTKIKANWEGEDFANGGISLRTDNFENVLQHDIPLSPRDMGSPLMDLKGRTLAINIARVDRVTTFALPVEVFWPTVQQWLDADRHPPKAESVAVKAEPVLTKAEAVVTKAEAVIP